MNPFARWSRRGPATPVTLFFLSGLTGLVYELVFTKLLGTIFGTTAYAAATVLAAFMGGLALGSAIISRFADRTRRPLRLYAWIELAIGGFMLAAPLLMDLVRASYVGLNQVAPLSPAQLNLVRFLLGGAVVVIPAALMGATLPLLARHFAGLGQGGGATIARLYAVNTFGAAAGTFAANYLLLPWTGIYGAVGSGVLLNLYVGWRAFRLDRGAAARAPAIRVQTTAGAEASSGDPARGLDRILLATAFATGLIALAYEVVWTHLLAVVVGTSAYAFGDMLLAFLLGIAGGSLWIARRPANRETQLARLARCQLGAGVAVVLAIPLWDHLPLLFKVVGYALPGFYVREGFRILASLMVMAVPTCLMGASFPLLIDGLRGGEERLGRRVGSAYALNTLGAIVGSTLTGFLLLPALGSRFTMLFAAAASVVVGLALLWVPGPAGANGRLRWAIAAPAVVLLGGFALPEWNYKTLLSGTNVYFTSAAKYDEILYVHEDVHGGVTSVARRGTQIEMRTNGKGQGDNHRQMEAQWGFALIPALLSRHHERAAVIGLGTGITAGTLARFPYRHIDVAEISPGIIEAAGRFFGELNWNVLQDPRVRMHLEDGRNMLLLAGDARYDLVTVELTSIWFAGAGNLYSREFFELVRDRLAPGGVFQQWVQLHHITPFDILRILNTMRQVFPHVTLWNSGRQGMIVASLEPIRAEYPLVTRLTSPAAMGPVLDSLPLRHPLALMGDLLLDEMQVDSVIGLVRARIGGFLTRHLFISSDLYPWIEYSTPRSNADVLQYGATLKFFENYDAHRPPLVQDIPSDSVRDLVYGVAALRKGNAGNALRLLERAAAVAPSDSALAALVAALRRRLAEHPL